jgi:TetR/AcrR family transcriptional regulator, transcriptional repressor for nem operon
MGRTAASQGDVRHALLIATQRLIEERGLRGFTIDDVAAEASVSKTALYHYFSNLQSLIEASVLFWFEERVAEDLRHIARLGRAGDVQEFRQAMAAHFAMAHDDERRQTRLNRTIIVATAASGMPSLRAGYEAAQRRLHQGMAEAIHTLKGRGIFTSDTDPSSVATLSLAITFGVAFNEGAGIGLNRDEWLKLLGRIVTPLLNDGREEVGPPAMRSRTSASSA